MRQQDKRIRIVSPGTPCLALLFAGLSLGCGKNQMASPARPDGGAPEVAADRREAGPEAGPETTSPPTDPASCAATVRPPTCDPGRATASITSAEGGPLLTSAVLVGPSGCVVFGCSSEPCTSIGVGSGSAGAGSVCDVIVIAADGRRHQVQLTVQANQYPVHSCCDVMGKPTWVATNPIVFSPSAVVVDFAADGADGGTDGSTDRKEAGASEAGRGEVAIDTYPDGKRDAYVTPSIPTDEASCVAATGVPTCEPVSRFTATIRSTGSGFLQSVVATDGPCGGSSCASGCGELTVYSGGNALAGSTCDLVVTFLGGAQQTVRLTLVQNPAPTYNCCGYPLPPNTGLWVATNPLMFSPNSVVVGSVIDGGAHDVGRLPDANFGE